MTGLSAERTYEPCYRVIVSASADCIVSKIAIAASGDEEARVKASALVDGRAVDLWDELRFIERFEPVVG